MNWYSIAMTEIASQSLRSGSGYKLPHKGKEENCHYE
jgi:hypothetical protein